MTEHQHDVVVIGAGFAGLGAAIKLAEAGVDDVVVAAGHAAGLPATGSWVSSLNHDGIGRSRRLG